MFKADDQSIEAFQNENKKIMGIMWHPERRKKIQKIDLKNIKKNSLDALNHTSSWERFSFTKKFRSKPKCLSIVNNKSILNHNINFFKKFKKKTIVSGYKSNLLINFSKENGFKLIVNREYRKTNMVHSLFLASKYINEDVVVCYGDIILVLLFTNICLKVTI